jgi:cyclopropane-fatty-acyl-phospholipid synthase
MADATSGIAAVVTELFAKAGIVIGGNGPADIKVHNPEFFAAVLTDGELAMGESYMAGWWDCQSIDALATRFIASDLQKRGYLSARVVLYALLVRLKGVGSRRRSFDVGERHYDLGNELFEAMLDRRMVYSCADWSHADTLDAAQEAKLDLVCRKLGLKPGQRILDIGCGWGGFARWAAERYGVSVVGITVSQEQAVLARQRCVGLPVEIRVCDYRDIDESFDHIASIAMVEAVGLRFLDTYMETVARVLRPDGRFVLHGFYGNEPVAPQHARWLDKYIFPGGAAPALWQILKAAEGRLAVEALHRLDGYDQTLKEWECRFEEAWPRLSARYDERFYRMWRFYLGISRAIFRARLCHVWHIVFSLQLPGCGLMPVFLPVEEIEAR